MVAEVDPSDAYFAIKKFLVSSWVKKNINNQIKKGTTTTKRV
jgi:hypothetical protein